jgi:hypothetical protein
MVENKSKHLSVRPALWVAGGSALACAVIWTGWGAYLYWNDVRLVNFLAAWIPFVLSILLAFVPEHKMTTIKKLLWRGSVIFVGFVWSAVLWHQQVVTDATARKDQEHIVASAVTKANEHSDQKIGAVQKDVQGVKTDVGGVKSDLKETKDTLSNMVSESEEAITSGLSKVGKPEPPELARLQFTLFPPPDDPEARLPILTRSISQDKDGNVSVDVSFTNTSGTAADTVEMWIDVCRRCSFAAEPANFSKPNGADVSGVNYSFPSTTTRIPDGLC